MVGQSRIGAALCLTGLLTVGACGTDAKPSAEGASTRGTDRGALPRDAREVRLARVEQTQLDQVIDISGTLAADEQVLVATKVAGRLASLEVDLASPVRQGQKIAQIETTDYEFGVQQAEAALGQARAQLGLAASADMSRLDVEATAIVRQAQATLEEASAHARRFEVLAEQGLTPQAELDTARAALARAKAGIESAREEVRLRQAQVRQREAELRIARQLLKDTAVLSPIDGFVQARRASAGEYLAAGAAIADVVRVDPLRLRLALPEREAASVRTGQRVQVLSDASGELDAADRHSGLVARLAPSLDAQSRSLLIEADIPNPGTLRPGNFVHARIVVGTRRALTVPQSAVVTFAGLQKVILVEGEKAVERPVTTGEVRAGRVEILTGLVASDAVVQEPGSLQQGQPVRVQPGT